MELRRILRRIIDGSLKGSNAFSTDDPLAEKVDWSPMASGGNSYRTHALRTVSSGRMEFQVGVRVRLARYLFLALGGGYLVLLLMMDRVIRKGGFDLAFVVVMLFMGQMIFFQLWQLMHRIQPVVIDKDVGFWWKGSISPGQDESLLKKGKAGTLSDIHAVQLILKNVRFGKQSFESVELNLVSHDGSRFHLVDHRDKSLVEDAGCLADFLDVPLWDARDGYRPSNPGREQFGRLSS